MTNHYSKRQLDFLRKRDLLAFVRREAFDRISNDASLDRVRKELSPTELALIIEHTIAAASIAIDVQKGGAQ